METKARDALFKDEMNMTSVWCDVTCVGGTGRLHHRDDLYQDQREEGIFQVSSLE